MILSCAPSVIWFRSTSWKSAIPADLISQGSNEMNQPSAVKHKLSVIHKKKTQQESSLVATISTSTKFHMWNKTLNEKYFSFSVQQINLKQEKKNVHDAVNIPLFFKTNIKYICLKANTFKSLTITNNADSFASSTKGWVQL